MLSCNELGKGAVIFLINRSYLTAFKVFLYTLRHAINEASEDIVVITDDPAVSDDPFVMAIADQIIKVGQHQIDKLKAINSSGIRKSLKTEEYGAYWYLKFLVYHDLGYDYHIFLDADMLCLSDEFRFTELPLHSDFAASRTIGPKSLRIHGATVTDEIRSTLLPLILNIAEPTRLPTAINSGVVIIGNALMGRGTVTGLIRVAADAAFRLEQDALWHYIRQRRDISVSPMPIWLNFPEYCKVVGKRDFEAHLRPKIRILHFNRHPKPWAYDRENSKWLHRLWWQAFDDSKAWVAAVGSGGTNPRHISAPDRVSVRNLARA